MSPKNTNILIACCGILVLLLFDRMYESDWKKARLLIWFLGGGFLLSSLWLLQVFREKTESLQQLVAERTSDLTDTNQKLVDLIVRNKAAEELLRESEKKYRLLAEHANDIIWTLSLDMKFTYISPSIFRIRGYTPEEGMSHALEEVITPDSLQYAIATYTAVMEKEAQGERSLGPTILELEHFCKNGKPIWMEVSMSLLRDQDGAPTGIIGVSRDISDRKQAEKALKESERKYRLIAENINDVIWTTDLSFHTTYISPSIERLRGYSPEEVMRQTLSEILSPASVELAARLFAAEHALEQKGERKNQNSILDLEFLCKDGSTVLLENSISPLRNETGIIIGLFGISRDITEQRRIEAQLLRSEKLASLGDMVAGVSHEISTPLGAGLLSASYLRDTSDEFTDMLWTGKLQLSDVKTYAEKIEKSSAMIVSNLERASALLNSFKNVAVDQLVKEKREFNIRQNMEETLNSLKPKFKHTSHTIILECPGDLIIRHYPGTFSQITTNLVMNSLIHGLEGIGKGEIRIIIEKQGDTLLLHFRDSGQGMNETVLKKMYDPFFTTKRNRGGTGLGLHIVHNLVCQTLMGQITCISSPGKGTEFRIKIPCHDAA
ncbi:MAG: PAS domain S-box protein [Pseudomonadota bacterium]